MTVTERPNAPEALDPPTSPLTHDAAEALIREARRRQRRRQFRIGAAVVVLVGTAVAVLAESNGGRSDRPVAPQPVHRVPKAPTLGTKSSQKTSPGALFEPQGALAAVTCQKTFCVAVGDSNEQQTGGMSWSEADPTSAVALTSVDDGVSWRTSTVPSGVTNLTSIVCPGAGDCLAVGQAGVEGQTGHVVMLESTDNGVTWKETNSFAGAAADLSCASAEQCVAVVGSDLSTLTTGTLAHIGPSIFYTVDGGSTWRSSELPALPTGHFSFYSVSCDVERFCLAGGGYVPTAPPGEDSTVAVLSSGDSGTTWQMRTDPTATVPGTTGPALSVIPDTTYCIAGDHCLIGGNVDGSKQGLIMTTHDGAAHWTPSSGWSPQDVPSVGSLGSPGTINCPTETYCIASSSYSMLPGTLISISTDGGNSWHPVEASMTPNHYAETEGLSSMSCTSAGRCVVVGSALNDWMYSASSTNGGISWTASTGVPTPPRVDMQIYAPIPPKPSSRTGA